MLGALFASLGVLQSFLNFGQENDEADRIKRQAELDRQVEAEQNRLDSEMAAREVDAKRDESRRKRAELEAMYATSGVLFDGSVSDVLTKQRERDEKNVQRDVADANQQLKYNDWAADAKFDQSLYQAKQIKSASKWNLLTGVAGAGIQGYAMDSDSKGGFGFFKPKVK